MYSKFAQMVEIFHRRSTQIQANSDGLSIVVNYWLGWPVFAFVVAWTSFSVFGVYNYWASGETGSTPYLQSAFSILGIGMMLWLIFGQEAMTFREQSIEVFRGMFAIGQHRTFSFFNVKDMRVGTFLDPHAQGKWEPRFVRATICFECRGKHKQFGNELGQAEAVRILEAIRQRYPQLVYTDVAVPDEKFDQEPWKPRTAGRLTPKTGLNPIVLLLFGLWIFWGFGIETVGARLEAQFEGVVVSSRDLPTTRGPRYATEYTLLGKDGQTKVYIAGPTDASLPRSIPVGTYLKKQKWHLYYERNERRVDDFPIFFYQVTLGIALACVLWSVILWRGHPRAA